MGWRSLIITRPARLRRNHYSLLIQQSEDIHIPFEDISVIVLDHQQILLTHPVLSACSEYGIALYSTDDTHHPAGIYLPFLKHTRATRQLRRQINLPKVLAKQLWAQVVRRKIENQGLCLKYGEITGHHRLHGLAGRVRSGDKGFMESQAAVYYFTQLFGPTFRRSDLNWVNAAMNYGYAILRGAISRQLVLHGFFPSIGLHHSSEQNAFNLSDDLIEPFRPLVDLYVVSHCKRSNENLSSAEKSALVSLLNVDVVMPAGTMNVLSAIENCIESLARAMEHKNSGMLELPVLAGLQQHVVES